MHAVLDTQPARKAPQSCLIRTPSSDEEPPLRKVSCSPDGENATFGGHEPRGEQRCRGLALAADDGWKISQNRIGEERNF